MTAVSFVKPLCNVSILFRVDLVNNTAAHGFNTMSVFQN